MAGELQLVLGVMGIAATMMLLIFLHASHGWGPLCVPKYFVHVFIIAGASYVVRNCWESGSFLTGPGRALRMVRCVRVTPEGGGGGILLYVGTCRYDYESNVAYALLAQV